MKRFNPRWIRWVAGLAIFFGGWQILAAKEDNPPPPVSGSPIHPTFPLLDENGENVLSSGQNVSATKTCGSCHDSEFISTHSFHADAGLSQMGPPGSVANGRDWDTSPGSFGRWNPLEYRYLSPNSDPIIDLTTAEWIQTFARHPGGGPAEFNREAQLLGLNSSGQPNQTNVENSIVNPDTGQLELWDWNASGTVEMNCFLCHVPDANNEARVTALASGDFDGATTATLLDTALLSNSESGWVWNQEAFDDNGHLLQEFVTLQDPTSASCGHCHGTVHADLATPLTLNSYTAADYSTQTTGQLVSPQRISESGLNLSGKGDLARSFDVHAERVLSCTDCHYSLNNPVYFQEADQQRPDHLIFDPRRIDLGEYLYRPLHQFAKGSSAQSILASGLNNTQRQCESCHTTKNTHEWLPFKDQHTTSLSCESCHVPELFAPAVETVDWTVLQTNGEPLISYRGLAEDGATQFSAAALLNGYEPILLPREAADGHTELAPFNLLTAWYWVYGDPARPVPLRYLEAAWLDGSTYPAEILTAFDTDQNGRLSSAELILDSDNKVDLLTRRLAAQGLENPRITGDIQPFSVSHNVTSGEWATRDCQTCHADESRLTQPFPVAGYTPGGVLPVPRPVDGLIWGDGLMTTDDGSLFWSPPTAAAGFYIIGHDAVGFIDSLGAFAFLGVIAGIFVHGGLRVLSSRQQVKKQRGTVRHVYMYDVYARLWHWLQSTAILLLLLTGLIIHRPTLFAAFSFPLVVQVHNVLAAILVINAAMAFFYHLASGEIQQYLPQPRGFFNQAAEQAIYYLRGIFRGDPHPVEKTRARKLNPLQQITYLAILNVLLPLQIITGALMWGVQQWSDLAIRFGGLPFLAPFHTLIAWLFASFTVLHVYLTTTGHTPTAAMRAMMIGWDQVEVRHLEPEADATSPVGD